MCYARPNVRAGFQPLNNRARVLTHTDIVEETLKYVKKNLHLFTLKPCKRRFSFWENEKIGSLESKYVLGEKRDVGRHESRPNVSVCEINRDLFSGVPTSW